MSKRKRPKYITEADAGKLGQHLSRLFGDSHFIKFASADIRHHLRSNPPRETHNENDDNKGRRDGV